jgi:hypothetical protein
MDALSSARPDRPAPTLAERIGMLEAAIGMEAPAAAGTADLWTRVGAKGLCFAAPHGAPHWRGFWRPRDRWTGPIAIEAARAADAYALVASGAALADGGAGSGEFPGTLARLVDERQLRLVVDLHGGAADRENPEILIGTGGGAPDALVDAAIGILRTAGFEVALREAGFGAGVATGSVVRYAREELKVGAFQLTLGEQLREATAGGDERLINALAGLAVLV